MLQKVDITDPGDTDFLPGDQVDKGELEAANEKTKTHNTAVDINEQVSGWDGQTVFRGPVLNSFYSLTATPASVTVAAGASATVAVSSAVVSGTVPAITLTTSAAPAGTTVALAANSIAAGGSTTLTIKNNTAAVGTYTITVTNAGPSAVTGATVADVLPTGTTFVSATGGATFDNLDKVEDLSGGRLVDRVLEQLYGDTPPLGVPRTVLVPLELLRSEETLLTIESSASSP